MTKLKQNSKNAYAAALLSLVALQINCSPTSAQSGFTLRGRATQQDTVKNQQPALQRTDMNRSSDPFGGPEAPIQQMEAAPPSFNVDSMRPPAPPLRGNAADEAGDAFNAMPGMMDTPQENTLQRAMPQQAPPPPQQMVNPNDPDSSPQMQLAWDAWHKRVAETIYLRYTKFSNFAFRHSPPLMASVGYVVHSNGQISSVQLLSKSSNFLYNTLIVTVINSLKGDPVLQFPPGSRRMAVDKSGTFTQNYGNDGFRYIQGDTETVRQR